MRTLESLNYFNDRRVIAGLNSRVIISAVARRSVVIINPNAITHVERSEWPTALKEALEYALERSEESRFDHSDLPDISLSLPCENALCPTCDGEGKVVNPSIDAGGIDFDGDDDFAAAYFNGAYDMRCPDCKGEKVVGQVKRQSLDVKQKALVTFLDNAQAHNEREAYERANELAWGY